KTCSFFSSLNALFYFESTGPKLLGQLSKAERISWPKGRVFSSAIKIPASTSTCFPYGRSHLHCYLTIVSVLSRFFYLDYVSLIFFKIRQRLNQVFSYGLIHENHGAMSQSRIR